MGSPEMPRPQQNQPEEIIRSGGMGSQLNKYVGRSETRIPPGKEWALTLLRKIPDTYKAKVTTFIMEIPHEDRQVVAEKFSEQIEAEGDQIWRSHYPEVEIQRCIDKTKIWYEAQEGKKKLPN
jgi:hypothetical protein